MWVGACLLPWPGLAFGSNLWSSLNKGKPQAVDPTMLRELQVPWSPLQLKKFHAAPLWICLVLATTGSASYLFRIPFLGHSSPLTFVLLFPCSWHLYEHLQQRRIKNSILKLFPWAVRVILSACLDLMHKAWATITKKTFQKPWSCRAEGLWRAYRQQVCKFCPSQKNFILVSWIPIQMLGWPCHCWGDQEPELLAPSINTG